MKAHTIIGLIVSIVAGSQLAAQSASSTAQRPPTAAVQAPATQSSAQPVSQQPTAQTNEPGSNLTVYLLTFGWGDVVGAWRYLRYDLKSDQAVQDLSFNGPMIGVTFRW